MEPVLILCTCANEIQARQIATVLVESQLASCVSLVPGVQSIYRWQNQIETSQEVQLQIKSCKHLWLELESKILEIHPYDVPEILVIKIQQGTSAYLDWMQSSLKPNVSDVLKTMPCDN